MKAITFYLDFISPYAYLAFETMPDVLMSHSYTVTYKPVLFAALLKHHGQRGPTEMANKREWTYRQVQWLAHQREVTLDLPATHPFNPLALLRLAVASQAQGWPNRYVCERIFHHVWQGGAEATDPERLAALTQEFAFARGGQDADVKAQLQAHTDEAIARGVFGVPTLEVDGKLFWGLDALPMLQAYLAGDPWFETHWDAAGRVGQGVRR